MIKEAKIDDDPESEKNVEFISKLINYIQYKRNKREIIRINRDLEWKKLVII